MKINIDAALQTEGWVGMGVIARDDKGEVLMAVVKQVRNTWTVTIVEAEAALFGVQLARRFHYQRILIESVCLPLI